MVRNVGTFGQILWEVRVRPASPTDERNGISNWYRVQAPRTPLVDEGALVGGRTRLSVQSERDATIYRLVQVPCKQIPVR